MSSSSSYDPDDEDASKSDLEPGSRVSKRHRSSTIIEGLTISSSSLEESEANISQSRHDWLWSQLENIPAQSLEAYTTLLAEIEDHIKFASTRKSEEILNVTQNGAVVWTATEKEVLFNVLDRKGRNGIKEIAAAIGTKSELEVMEYLRLLHRGLENQLLLEENSHSVTVREIPAAAEISKECCDVLDEYANVLAVKEEIDDAGMGRKIHGNHWNITYTEAQKLTESENDETAAGGVFLAAGLLNVPVMVNCSRRLFMNFGKSRIEDNWTNLVTAEEESPSLTADALLDFYALTVSITRRLIQSSLFFAMARLRSMRRPGRERINAVRKKDVQTALDVLNMKRDRSDFWVKLARRNSLEVADIHNRKGWIPRVFSYDEVENILRGNDDYFQQVSKHGILPDDQQVAKQDQPVSRASSELSSPLSESDETPLDPETEHTDFLDKESSRLEELDLWEMLEQPAPSFLNGPIKTTYDDKDIPQNSQTERNVKQDLVDWRDRTLYRSEWEEYGYELPDLEDDLAENRRKRRRVEDAFSTSPSHSHSDIRAEDVHEGAESDDDLSPSSHVSSDEEEMEVDEDVDSPGDADMDSGLRSRLHQRDDDT